MVWIILTLLRLVLPFSILRWPLIGVLASSILDFNDYYYLKQSGFDMHQYQIWDKILDTYYLGFAAYIALGWKENLARRIAIGSFLYRAFGVLLVIITNTRELLLFFPNFFENFFIFYLIYHLFRKLNLFINKKILTLVVSSILIPKLLQEYLMHFAKTSPTKIFDLSKLPVIGTFLPRPPDDFVQIILYFTLPVVVLIWLLKTGNEKRKEPVK